MAKSVKGDPAIDLEMQNITDLLKPFFKWRMVDNLDRATARKARHAMRLVCSHLDMVLDIRSEQNSFQAKTAKQRKNHADHR